MATFWLDGKKTGSLHFDFAIGLVSFLLINGFTLALYANNVYASIQNVAHEKRLARENLLAGQSEKNRWIQFIRKIRYMAANVLSEVVSPYVCTGSSHTAAWSELNIVRDT